MPAEGFDPSTVPATRGRRNPQIAQAMQADAALAESEVSLTEGDPTGDEPIYALLEGDVVMCKVTHTVPFDGKDSWFTYGVQSRVQPGENEEDTFVRLATVVNTRVLDLAADSEEAVLEMQERYSTQGR